MSRQPRRGRMPKGTAKSSPLRMFYVLIGVVAVVGFGAISLFYVQNQQRATAPAAPAGEIPAAPAGPTGRTPDGFAYKGNDSAAVVVTEYSDFQ